jgi:hypothetical protein
VNAIPPMVPTRLHFIILNRIVLHRCGSDRTRRHFENIGIFGNKSINKAGQICAR